MLGFLFGCFFPNFVIGLILKLLNLSNSSTTLILVFLSISLTLCKCWAMVIDVKSCSLVIPGKVSKQENTLHSVHFSYITAHCTVENECFLTVNYNLRLEIVTFQVISVKKLSL